MREVSPSTTATKTPVSEPSAEMTTPSSRYPPPLHNRRRWDEEEQSGTVFHRADDENQSALPPSGAEAKAKTKTNEQTKAQTNERTNEDRNLKTALHLPLREGPPSQTHRPTLGLGMSSPQPPAHTASGMNVRREHPS